MIENTNRFTIHNDEQTLLMNEGNEMQDTSDAGLKKRQKGLMSALRNAKLVQMSVIHKILASPDAQGKENEFLAYAATLTSIDTVIRHMTEQLDDVNLKLEKLHRIIPDPRHNVVAWSKKTIDRSNDLCRLLASVCGVGAAITYTTIFSATRGSVGLMSWAFTFFFMGFTLPTGTQIVLSWAATIMPPDTKFPSILLKLWGINAAITILWGVLSTVAALFFLLISLYGIQYSPATSGGSPTLLLFTNLPRYAFWLALSLVSFGVLHVIGLMLVLIWCNTWKSLKVIYFMSD